MAAVAAGAGEAAREAAAGEAAGVWMPRFFSLFFDFLGADVRLCKGQNMRCRVLYISRRGMCKHVLSLCKRYQCVKLLVPSIRLYHELAKTGSTLCKTMGTLKNDTMTVPHIRSLHWKCFGGKLH